MRNGNTASERRPLSLSPDSSSFRTALPAILLLFSLSKSLSCTFGSSSSPRTIPPLTFNSHPVSMQLSSQNRSAEILLSCIRVYRMSSFNLLNYIYIVRKKEIFQRNLVMLRGESNLAKLICLQVEILPFIENKKNALIGIRLSKLD